VLTFLLWLLAALIVLAWIVAVCREWRRSR
jgi:hypothetical protein